MGRLAFTVQADTEGACADALDQLCKLAGLVVTVPPSQFCFGERWMGRARPAHDNAPTWDGSGRGE